MINFFYQNESHIFKQYYYNIYTYILVIMESPTVACDYKYSITL